MLVAMSSCLVVGFLLSMAVALAALLMMSLLWLFGLSFRAACTYMPQ
jgi:hypothetical protein